MSEFTESSSLTGTNSNSNIIFSSSSSSSSSSSFSTTTTENDDITTTTKIQKKKIISGNKKYYIYFMINILLLFLNIFILIIIIKYKGNENELIDKWNEKGELMIKGMYEWVSFDQENDEKNKIYKIKSELMELEMKYIGKEEIIMKIDNNNEEEEIEIDINENGIMKKINDENIDVYKICNEECQCVVECEMDEHCMNNEKCVEYECVEDIKRKRETSQGYGKGDQQRRAGPWHIVTVVKVLCVIASVVASYGVYRKAKKWFSDDCKDSCPENSKDVLTDPTIEEMQRKIFVDCIGNCECDRITVEKQMEYFVVSGINPNKARMLDLESICLSKEFKMRIETNSNQEIMNTPEIFFNDLEIYCRNQEVEFNAIESLPYTYESLNEFCTATKSSIKCNKEI